MLIVKKLISIILSIIIAASVFTAVPLSSSAAAKKKASPKVSLKKTSATLKISRKKNKNVYGSTTIKVKKAKGVTIKKKSFKSNKKKIAKVSSKGKVTAKKKGSAKITVTVKYKYKKKAYTKKLTFKVKVKDVRKTKASSTSTEPSDPANPAASEAIDSNEEIQNAKALNNVKAPTGNSDTFTDSAFLSKLSNFSNKLYEMSSKEQTDNYTMSPVSVYMALAMLHSIGDKDVKSDIEQLAGMTDADIAKTGALFKSLTKKYTSYGGDIISRLTLTNSIWVDEGLKTNQDTLDMLADDYYCDAYETPFSKNNAAANQAVRDFIKKQTNGMIDQDFQIPASTLFALINTLYFKDVWDTEINELGTEQRVFKTSDKEQKCEFLLGKYIEGQVQETNSSKYFYSKTAHGYKVKFILPKTGYILKQAMSAENLNKINQDTEFNETEGKTKHYTRCIFPSFKVDSYTPLKEILQKNNQLTHAFCEYTSPLVDIPLQVSDIKHKVVVDVSKTGVEGAAVTIVISKAASAYDPTVKQYHDFVLDSGFGFIITDPNDVVLFEGKITNPTNK